MLCPPRCDSTGAPFTSFNPAVRKVNAGLRETLPSKHPGRVEVVDCGDVFLDVDGRVDLTLMEDALHPNAKGMGLLADCLLSKSAFLRREARRGHGPRAARRRRLPGAPASGSVEGAGGGSARGPDAAPSRARES